MDDILDSRDDSELWVLGKLDRVSTYNVMAAVLTALCDITTSSPTDWRLPEQVHLRPARQGEARYLRANGEAVLFKGDALAVVIQLPEQYLTRSFRVVAHVVDRCAINSSCTR